MAQDRKSDTRQKIELGGLVIKAGLGGENKALVLGVLIDGAARLARTGERERIEGIGHDGFAKDRRGSAP